MLKPIDMPTVTQHSVDLVQSAQEQHLRAEIANAHANRMDRQSVANLTQTVTEAEKTEQKRVNEKKESDARERERRKKEEQRREEAKLPNVGFESEKRLDIRI